MNATEKKGAVDELLSPARILETARAQVRRFGEAKTNVVDIARALGTSHTTIYRHFRSKAEVFDAIIQAEMQDEEALAKEFADSAKPAADRLTGLVLALHRRKREKYADDPEVYSLYRRVVDDRPDLVRGYAEAMTRLIADILGDGVRRGEYKLDDVAAAAEVVRDAATVYVHPAHVEAASKAGISMEPALHRMMTTLNFAFSNGLSLRERNGKQKKASRPSS